MSLNDALSRQVLDTERQAEALEPSMKAMILTAAILAGLPAVGCGAELPSASLSVILALPDATGTIAGTNFAFNYPLNGIPEYFSGPWARGDYWGPASAVTFTPLAGDATQPGFTLSGDFHSSPGRYNDITLGFFSATAPLGMVFDSVTVQIGNPTAAGESSDNLAFLNSCAAYAALPSASCEGNSGNLAYFSIDLRFYNRGVAPSVGFDSATFLFHEAPAAVPEPASAALLALGGLGIAGWLGRRRVGQRPASTAA
jgi:hypothetical protein